uniref:Uncharacterized protein n=1 Tax=Chromera velia CCMP2878 TaxID=1169474 RepID=A0A0G4GFL8_9ALVE|eukprot:Cvel_21674.t1-p1 / transcript=Cvel_21674.t1 / gene=Cvel_21674 / organism=Chromera_velia_CCMP2878 / gene_product=hypothetical protein / transcript_product=hypothetical protein / location=Cvel_scaffold2053:31175-31804(+) / protein_length=210 / sequence_SO=supercontig / SO=protein_coding / is_pseudo=false
MPREGLSTLTPLLITEEDIAAVARCLQGSAGPSGFDSTYYQLRIAVLSLERESRELREELVNLATKMGRRVFEWDQVKALIACRLVALDKCPGVRPVGIGEAIKRLLGNAVMKETRKELQEACGANQLCSGLMGGLEGGIHAVRELWETLTQEAGDDSEKAFGTLLIDAKKFLTPSTQQIIQRGCGMPAYSGPEPPHSSSTAIGGMQSYS